LASLIVAEQVTDLGTVRAASGLKCGGHGFTDFVEAGNRIDVCVAEGRGSTGADRLVDWPVAGFWRGEHLIDHRYDGCPSARRLLKVALELNPARTE
jgi:hypothetical protein